MGPFISSFINEYILLAVNYVSMWVKAIPTRTNDAKLVVMFLWEIFFARFSMPRSIVSDQDAYFTNRSFNVLLRRYSIAHKLTSPYHPQASG